MAQHALLAEEYRFGFSGGCVSFHEADHSYRDALLRADALRYEAKKQGKGNILLAGSGLTGPDIFS